LFNGLSKDEVIILIVFIESFSTDDIKAIISDLKKHIILSKTKTQ